MTDYTVIDGPLVANMKNPDGSTFNAGTVPVGTDLSGTGNTNGVWIEAASPYQKSKGVTAWYHRDYLSEKSAASAVPSERQQREKLALDIYWGIAGRSLDVDKVPHDQPNQCVDVSKYLGTKFAAPLRPYGHGKDVAYNMGALPGWTRKKYVPGMIIPALAVLSWGDPYGVDRKTKEVYGHTAYQLTDSTTPDVAQQNGFKGDTVVHRATLDTDGLLWIAIPPFIAKTVKGSDGQQYHSIASGETMWAISMKYGIDVSVIRELNPSVDPMRLSVGDKIRIA